jgi:hypothetical protein
MVAAPVKKVYSTHKVDKTEFIVDAVLVSFSGAQSHGRVDGLTIS